MKSCQTCPSFTDDATKTNQQFGKSVGQPVCLRYGHILGAPGSAPEADRQVQLWYARTCDSHGEPAPDVPVEIRMRIAEAREETTPKTEADIQTCNNCSHYVTPPACNQGIGVNVGMCSVKGKLVLSPIKECRDCPWADVGTPHNDTGSVRLLPEYAPGFKVDQHLSVQEMLNGVEVDPTEFDSDLPLSDDDKAAGIRAWRYIEDPSGEGRPAAIPIFGEGVFGDYLSQLVPQAGGKHNPDKYLDHGGALYAFAVDSWNLGDTLCLVGEPGTGKTEAARFFAWNTQLPFQRFAFDAATEVDDMVGKTLYDPERGTYFQKGRIVTFAEHPGIGDWDEWNTSPDECQQMSRPILDGGTFWLDKSDGAQVTVHPHNRTVVAINPAWDFRNLGTKELAGADVSRLSFLELEFPPEAIVKQVARERCRLIGYDISEDVLNTIYAITEDLREASRDHHVPFTWQLREVVKVARKTKFYGLSKAFGAAILDYQEPSVRELALQLIEGHLA